MAPKSLIGKGHEIDRDFRDRPVMRQSRPQTIATADDLQWDIDNCKRVLRGRTVDKRKVEQDLSFLTRDMRTAARLEARRAHTLAASGINEALTARKAAFDHLAETVMETMGHDAVTMDGVVIKAMALEAWSRHADLIDAILVPGSATWGQQLAASILRLAGEA
ncbi:hypothetical protein AJ88_03960 [Mesorhizobium amorphae CCBAU 01583]|nr:hypothetical protein AJ88_03960 [Mesorhizobium amorphae CCBAU 01583]